MGFLVPALSGLLGIGGSIIGANAQRSAQQQAAEEQQKLEQQAFNQQVGYNNAASAAARQAFLGLAGNGNPYFQAAQSMPKPQFLAGGSFGPGAAPPQVAPAPQIMPQQMPMPSANAAAQQGFVGTPPPQPALRRAM